MASDIESRNKQSNLNSEPSNEAPNLLTRFFFGQKPKKVKINDEDQSTHDNNSFVSKKSTMSSSPQHRNSMEEARREALNEASLLLIDRLFQFLSMLPSPDGHEDEDYEDIHSKDDDTISTHAAYSQYSLNYRSQTNSGKKLKNRGLTLPAAAIGWLASNIYPNNNYSHTPHDPQGPLLEDRDIHDDEKSTMTNLSVSFNHTNANSDDKLAQNLALLKWLLRKVTYLRVTCVTWPPDPPALAKGKNATPKRLNTYNAEDDDQSIYEDDSSIATNDFSTNSFLQNSRTIKPRKSPNYHPINELWHELRSFPCVDLQLFPNLNVFLSDGVPPEWIQNLSIVQKNLHLLSFERGAIFDINAFLFPFYDITHRDAEETSINHFTLEPHQEQNQDEQEQNKKEQNHFNLEPHQERNQDEQGRDKKEQKNMEKWNPHQNTISDADMSPLQYKKSETYPRLTHLKLSHCVIGELSGLRGIFHNHDHISKQQIREIRRKMKNSQSLDHPIQSSANDAIRIHTHPPPLARMSSLQTLSLSNNQLIHANTALSGLSSLPNLSSIDLSFNFISSMKNCYLKLGNIRTLILSNNQISTVSNGLDRLFSLEKLSLDRNRIENLQDVVGLSNLPFLARLDLWGNPLMDNDEEGYRINVLSLFMQTREESDLPTLDNLQVSDDELRLLEKLDFGDIVKVENVRKDVDLENDHDLNVSEDMSTENQPDEESKFAEGEIYELPPLAAIDDTDTASSSSSFPQSSASHPVLVSASKYKKVELNRQKIKRTRERKKAFIHNEIHIHHEDELLSNIAHSKGQGAFCTIDIDQNRNKKINNKSTYGSPSVPSEDKVLVESMIDQLTLLNPYLIERKAYLTPPLETSSNRQNLKESPISKTGNDRTDKEADSFDKSRFAFLTQNIDFLDDDKDRLNNDDNEKDNLLVSFLKSYKMNNKSPSKESSSKWIPLFPTDIDTSVDVDENQSVKKDPLDMLNDITSNEKKTIETTSPAIDTKNNELDTHKISLIENNDEASTKENDNVSTGADSSSLDSSSHELEPLYLNKKSETLRIDQISSKNGNDDEEAHDESDDVTVSTIASLQSQFRSNYRKNQIPTIRDFSESKTSENISLIQKLLADDDDDDYWNDKKIDNDKVGLSNLDPITMLDNMNYSKSEAKSIISQFEFDFDLAEAYATYDAPQKYADKPVSGNLDLYFRTYVFPLTMCDENDDARNDVEKLLSLAVPRIQLCLADRDEIIQRTNNFQEMSIPALLEEIKGGERFIRFWYDKLLPCGVAAKSRIEPVFTKLRSFHGVSIQRNGKNVMVSESQPSIICLSDQAVYFITVKYKQKRQTPRSDNDSSLRTSEESLASEVTFLTRLTKNGEDRTYPSPLPVKSTFKDCNWPHALARHSLVYLHRLTIGFGFQRLTFHFQVQDDDGLAHANYSYVIHTWNKKRTVSIIQALQSNNKVNDALIIDNDDILFLESLGRAVDPKPVGAVLHYQMVFQKWKRGDRNIVRRACVVTDTTIFLLDENYVGDGAISSKRNKTSKNIGDVELRSVDSAALNHIIEVKASDEDPSALLLVVPAPSFLQRSHRWRLVCKDRDGAERLIQFVRSGMT